MDDITKEEHGLLKFDLSDRSRFYPLGELVDGDK
jgi:hypothetical protein